MFLLYLKWGTLVGGAVSPKEFASWTTHSSSTAFVCDFTSENVTEDIKRKRTRTHTHTRARAHTEREGENARGGEDGRYLKERGGEERRNCGIFPPIPVLSTVAEGVGQSVGGSGSAAPVQKGWPLQAWVAEGGR